MSLNFVRIGSLISMTLCLVFSPQAGRAAHAISMDGQPKYMQGFKRFDYTFAQPKVGGTLVLYAIGAFDKLNPFTLKGAPPYKLSEVMFESLTTRSMDEPFTQYGLLAKDIQVAADGMSVIYTLDPNARFSDGTPVTAEDVRFSLEILKSDKAAPLYQIYFQDIAKANVLSPQKVEFVFSVKNRELPLISGEIPILSKAYFEKFPFDKPNMTDIPLGSGPYLVEEVQPGKTITYRRNPNYWGWHLPVRQGFFNFERIMVKTFLDPTVAMEAFKAGEFDFKFENSSKAWARDHAGDKFDSGRIIKETLPHGNGAGMQGFVFNLRRPVFQDRRVREAFILAFDFEWSNKNLFYDQYTRSSSYFSNSEMAATGKPTPGELKLLEPLRGKLLPEVFQEVTTPPTTTPPSSIRDNLRRASQLLKEAGWSLGSDKILVNAKGERMEVEALLDNPQFNRVFDPYASNLSKLGIKLNFRTVDHSLYQERRQSFDFDMIVDSFPQSQSPGNEQRDMWHSASAKIKGTRNTIGLQDEAVDALVEKVIYASNRAELVDACRALDRVLLAGHYLVPNYHIPFHRVSYWSKLKHPEKFPLYYAADDWLMTWQLVEEK
ncbi:MAG: ABC transporter substrate-binding protein [Magnetococcales bacterium]|nr:ABC transporter substrate-binding protein [Magnetococcales bacterium]